MKYDFEKEAMEMDIEKFREKYWGSVNGFAEAVIEAYKDGGGTEEEAKEYFRKHYT